MTKENVIANVQASLGSLFTKDDVIKDCMRVNASEYQREVQNGIEEIFNDLWAEHQMRTEIVNENN